jgi:hypothetical protein
MVINVTFVGDAANQLQSLADRTNESAETILQSAIALKTWAAEWDDKRLFVQSRDSAVHEIKAR